MIKNLFQAFVALLVSVLFLVTPARAQESDSILTPLYGVGVAEIPASSAAQEICRRWQSCEASAIDCDIVVEAATSNNEHVVRSRGTSFEFVDEAALGYARQANLVQQVQWACPASASDLDIKIGTTWPHKRPSLGFRYAWATVRPAVDPAVLAGLAADMAPPPPVVINPDEAFDFAKLTMWDHRNNMCPTRIWVNAATHEISVSGDDCACSQNDVSQADGYQVYSEHAEDLWLSRMRDADATLKSATWTEMLRFLADNPRNWNEVDVNGSAEVSSDTDGGGLGVEFHYSGSEVVVQFPDRCERKLEADLLTKAQAEAKAIIAEYTGTDFVVLGAGSLTASVLGDGSSLTTHPAGTLVAEVGIETGTPKAAFLGTIGLGGYFDDNCDMPAAWLMQLRLGATFNRSETVGMLVDARVQYSFAPSYVINPDDPETEENEYSASSALGTNAAAFLVDIGPRFAFGRGVHNGWIAPTLTAGPKLRWFDDNAGQQRVTLTADFGGTVNIGFDW